MAFDEAFWRSEREKLQALLVPVLRAAAIDGGESGLDHLLEVAGVGVDWGLVNQHVQRWAQQHGTLVADAITDTSRRFLQQALNDWIGSGEPLSELIDQLTPAFGKVRAQMIAVTEVTRAFHAGNAAVWKESGIVREYRIRNAQDDSVCPQCSPLEGKAFPLDDQASAPPIHVRCRCWSQPVVDVSEDH